MSKITINKQSNGPSMNFPIPIYALAKTMSKQLLQAVTLLCLINTFAIAKTTPVDDKNTNSIQTVEYSTLPGNRLQISLELSKEAVSPLSFTIDNPARIAFDFAGTASKLPKRPQPIGIGVAQSITTISTKTKTRVILNLTEVVPYQITTQGKKVLITLDSEATGAAFDAANTSTTGTTPTGAPRFTDKPRGIDKIDFRRGEEGEGRVVINLTESNIPMDISEEFGKVVVKFLGIKLPDELRQTLDVLDFATPVKSISSFEEDDNVRIEIEPISSNYEHVAYQANNIFTIELKPISKEELDEIKKEKFGYTGERLSLNFQDIPVRAVLQLIADFTSLNVVVSDSVDGNLTLRLKNVPWDQALDIILKAKGLSKRESGTVMMIAPSEEIAAQEKIDLEAQQSITELAPIRSAFFTINFAKVTSLAALFTGEGSGGDEEGSGSSSTGMLSPRGSVIIDERTNTLIIKDTEEVISEVRRTLAKLDIPIRQVMISSRIVIATDEFTKELGSRFGVTSAKANSDGFGVTTGTFQGADTISSSGLSNIATGGSPEPFTLPSGVTATDRLNVDLGTINAAGSLAFSVLTGSSLIDLEISALQAENKGEVISSPRVVTADRHEARIEQGVEIPYLSATSSGATQVEFKKAVLSIEVTPQITPDDRVIMDLSVNNDTVGDIFAGIPSIDTREVTTQVLVNNGDTVVLGGIYEQITRDEVDKVPFLGDLPIIGYFFRHTLESDERRELLIFVTPKILKDALSL